MKPARCTLLLGTFISTFLHASGNYVPIIRKIYCINATLIFFTPYVWLLRRCATNRKVAGSIPDGVIGFFIDIKSFRSHYGPGVDSASNRNEYQEYFLGVKAAGA